MIREITIGVEIDSEEYQSTVYQKTKAGYKYICDIQDICFIDNIEAILNELEVEND